MPRFTNAEEVFRGIVVLKTTKLDEYGNPVPVLTKQYVGPYARRGTARGQTTVVARMYPQSDVVESYVERSTSWERLD